MVKVWGCRSRERRESALGSSRRLIGRLNVALDLLSAGDQLGGTEVEAGGQAAQAGIAGVALAGLDVTDPALMEFGA